MNQACLNFGGDDLSAYAEFRCVEPLRKLVTTEKTADGKRYVNPSRLVMGTNAVLKVGVKGEFSAEDVDWRVVSGPGRIVATNGWCATVEPTGANEDVIVEARFNGDEIQPRFVLPVVQTRTIPVRMFVVEPPDDSENEAWSSFEVLEMLDTANEIFTQVGIRFELAGGITSVGTTNDWTIPLCDVVTNSAGVVSNSEYVSAQMISLLGHCRTNDCIEVYFTGSILNYDADAFTCVSGIVVDRDSGDHVLAHELGHALGLHDIYHHLPGVDSIGRKAMFRLKERRNVVEVGYFSSRVKDWGYEHGRGFYEQGDVLASVIDKLLMHGLYADGAGDIPDGCVHGLSKAHNKGFQNVGAGDIKKENWSVFSK